MNFIYKSEIIDYNLLNNNAKQTIVFLHGWGGNKNSFISTVNLFKSKYNIFTITMPTINPTIEVWNILDYVTLIETLIDLHCIKNIIIVCHSFGFRVASVLASKIKIDKLIVTGGAGLKLNNPIKRLIANNKKIWLNKWKFLYKQIASSDYVTLTDTNKKTFKNIVNIDTKNFIKFNCPILLFWGKLDHETPIWIAKQIFKANDAKLITTNKGHFAYLDDNAYFNNEIKKFIEC